MGKSIRLDGNDSVQTIQKINEALAAQGLAFVLDEGRVHEGIAYLVRLAPVSWQVRPHHPIQSPLPARQARPDLPPSTTMTLYRLQCPVTVREW